MANGQVACVVWIQWQKGWSTFRVRECDGVKFHLANQNTAHAQFKLCGSFISGIFYLMCSECNLLLTYEMVESVRIKVWCISLVPSTRVPYIPHIRDRCAVRAMLSC